MVTTSDTADAVRNEQPPRLRPAWARLLVLVVLFVAVDAIFGTVVNGARDNPVAGLCTGLSAAFLALLVYAGAVRFLERRPVAELARRGALGAFGRGTLIGLGFFPTAVSGGSFGPEASIVAILVSLIPTVLFLRMAWRAGRILPRRGRAARPVNASL